MEGRGRDEQEEDVNRFPREPVFQTGILADPKGVCGCARWGGVALVCGRGPSLDL